MTIALFSDIHANLPALEAMLDDIDRRRPDMIFCLGDLVGYAPWPNEVVEKIRHRGIPTIAGNYDEGVGLNSDDCGCAYRTEDDRRRGDESIAFTNRTVSSETRAYLRGLPRQLRLHFHASDRPNEHSGDASARPNAHSADTSDPAMARAERSSDLPRTGPAASDANMRLLMVHGSPRKINEYLFEDRPDASFLRMMDAADADIMLFGHTHKPYHKAIPYEIDGEKRRRHAVNIGSVGKPKDGDPRACYVLLHTDPLEIEFVRVEYDVERAARAIESSPLPDEFAEMLRSGT